MSTPAWTLKSSADRWGYVPAPAVPKVRGGFDFFASSTNSFRLFAGTDGCTTKRPGLSPM
jgi:hypothetical protein